MGCNECKETRDVSYIVFESAMSRAERTIKRLWILAIILIALLFGTNAAWIYYEAQFEYAETTETIEVDSGGGGNAVYNNSGEVNINGESKVN